MSERNVRTIFYADKQAQVAVKKIASGNPIRATGRAVEHMRRNTYKAVLAEVYDEYTGKLYAVIVHDLTGVTTILYQAKLRKEESGEE